MRFHPERVGRAKCVDGTTDGFERIGNLKRAAFARALGQEPRHQARAPRLLRHVVARAPRHRRRHAENLLVRRGTKQHPRSVGKCM